ncbi:MAG: response regulator [Lachnospiraceae bacterium]|nr:response regulator [Lachnospiraceae bacterium]
MEQFKKFKRIRIIFSVIFMLGAAGLSIYFSTLQGHLAGFELERSPLLMTGALCGNLPGIISVLLVFHYKTMVDNSTTYVIALYMIAVLLAAVAARHKVYRSFIKTFLFGAVLALILGAANGLVFVYTTIGSMSDTAFSGMVNTYVYALPECIGTAILIYLVYKVVPDRIKIYIPNGIYYLDESDSAYKEAHAEIDNRKKEATSRLSFRITRVIILEAILLSITAAAFAIYLVSIMNTAIMRPGGAVSQNMASDSFMQEDNPPAKPDESETPPEKPDGEEGAPPENGERPPRPVGIFGERLEDSISSNVIFNDNRKNRARNNSVLDTHTAIAFAFRLVMILFTFTVVIAALADAYMQFSVARPIRSMSEAMQGFAFSNDDGSISGSEQLSGIRIRSKDEIEELYHALVKTVADTEDYLERLREEDKMKNELEVAKASSKAKSTFLSSMSHEIRTPINAVLGFDEMILMENKDPEIGKYAEDIQSAGRTLLALVNDILDFQKIEAGKMDIIPTQYELTSTINDVVSMTMSLANDKELAFDVNVDPATPHLLYGDEIRIKQCMTNILSNAVKYTEKGGLTLSVGFDRVKDDDAAILLNVSVKDTGIGIKEEDMDKLFSAFDRLDQVRNKAVKGTGLGMSITKQLLENMGSKLEVESVYEKGSNFHFSVKQQVTKWEEIGDLTEAFKKYIPHEGSGHKNDTFFAPSADILVTDDTENNLLVVTRLLKRTGIHIDTADSGVKTLELIRQKKYDIIYLDHMMPEMDGIETLHRMKELEGNMNTDTPVIVLTANAGSGSREMYMKEGFTDYMTKPVSYVTLKDSLLKYLPKEKVEEKSGRETGQEHKEERSAQSEGGSDIMGVLADIQGIDVSEGIRYSGDMETLIDVIKGYSENISDSSDRIERELADMDIKNYTVHVHALKSSSRLIGAKELSEMALDMENTGNAYQRSIAEGDVDGASEALSKLEKKTPELLTLYRSYKEKLAPIMSAGTETAEADGLPEISSDDLKEMLMGIREFAEAFDMDSVDSTMSMIEGYAIPDESRELIASLKKAVRNVDRDAILSLLESE